jgi:hypothetical protein
MGRRSDLGHVMGDESEVPQRSKLIEQYLDAYGPSFFNNAGIVMGTALDNSLRVLHISEQPYAVFNEDNVLKAFHKQYPEITSEPPASEPDKLAYWQKMQSITAPHREGQDIGTYDKIAMNAADRARRHQILHNAEGFYVGRDGTSLIRDRSGNPIKDLDQYNPTGRKVGDDGKLYESSGSPVLQADGKPVQLTDVGGVLFAQKLHEDHETAIARAKQFTNQTKVFPEMKKYWDANPGKRGDIVAAIKGMAGDSDRRLQSAADGVSQLADAYFANKSPNNWQRFIDAYDRFETDLWTANAKNRGALGIASDKEATRPAPAIEDPDARVHPLSVPVRERQQGPIRT